MVKDLGGDHEFQEEVTTYTPQVGGPVGFGGIEVLLVRIVDGVDGGVPRVFGVILGVADEVVGELVERGLGRRCIGVVVGVGVVGGGGVVVVVVVVVGTGVKGRGGVRKGPVVGHGCVCGCMGEGLGVLYFTWGKRGLYSIFDWGS